MSWTYVLHESLNDGMLYRVDVVESVIEADGKNYFDKKIQVLVAVEKALYDWVLYKEVLIMTQADDMKRDAALKPLAKDWGFLKSDLDEEDIAWEVSILRDEENKPYVDISMSYDQADDFVVFETFDEAMHNLRFVVSLWETTQIQKIAEAEDDIDDKLDDEFPIRRTV